MVLSILLLITLTMIKFYYYYHPKEVFVAILAIWKAGKTYIPVDPKYPDEYIKNILLIVNLIL